MLEPYRELFEYLSNYPHIQHSYNTRSAHQNSIQLSTEPSYYNYYRGLQFLQFLFSSKIAGACPLNEEDEEDPVPGDPVPGDPVPGDPVPGDPVPVDPVHVDPVHVDPVHVDPVHVDPVPVDQSEINEIN
jgi:hypothetical protein